MYQYGTPPMQPVVFVPSPGAPQQPQPQDSLRAINETIAFYEGVKRSLKDEMKDKEKGKDEKKKSDWGFVETFVIISLAYPLLSLVQLAVFWKLFH